MAKDKPDVTLEEFPFQLVAEVALGVQDITDRYQVTPEKAEAFLQDNEESFMNAMWLAGWNIIAALAKDSGFEPVADDDDDES